MSKIALITGSTRTPRVGTDVADWVFEVIKLRPEDKLQVEPLSIADFNLPIYDEPVMPAMVPAMQQFTKEHSKKWSEAIISFQGYVFVIPEYNGSMSGATKNAIDYLYNEWPGKPVAIISYGTQGGERANKHLSESLELVMKMKVVPTKVKLAFAQGNDVMTAINDGKLGDDTRKAWTEAGAKDQILKAFGEVKAILEQ
jgi:NAD(P)H-dependent FMN reductase